MPRERDPDEHHQAPDPGEPGEGHQATAQARGERFGIRFVPAEQPPILQRCKRGIQASECGKWLLDGIILIVGPNQ